MLTTVQDLGRTGHRREGVCQGGAVDRFALRLANLLVGNPEDAPALEITLTGPELEFTQETWIACCGARFEGVDALKPRRVAAGERIRFGARLEGCRAYLAVAGGLEVPEELGGRGTHLAAGFGGHRGRALRDADVLTSAGSGRRVGSHWSVDARLLPHYTASPTVRVLAGTHAGLFSGALYETTFRVGAQSDRMGMRLEGPSLAASTPVQLVSSAVAPGTVQVPPDGKPIVLLADAQTLGGYPRAAHVITVDLPLLAQLAPGDCLRFAPVDLATAHEELRDLGRRLSLLRQGLAGKIS